MCWGSTRRSPPNRWSPRPPTLAQKQSRPRKAGVVTAPAFSDSGQQTETRGCFFFSAVCCLVCPSTSTWARAPPTRGTPKRAPIAGGVVGRASNEAACAGPDRGGATERSSGVPCASPRPLTLFWLVPGFARRVWAAACATGGERGSGPRAAAVGTRRFCVSTPRPPSVPHAPGHLRVPDKPPTGCLGGGAAGRSSTRSWRSTVDDTRHDWLHVRGRRTGPQLALTIGCWAAGETRHPNLQARAGRAALRPVCVLFFTRMRLGAATERPCQISS